MILDGKKLADKILANLKTKITKNKTKPKLVIILVGKNPSSLIYVKYKKKACEKIGIDCQIINHPENVNTQEIIKDLKNIKNNPSINGVIIQLPLPKHLDFKEILNYIPPKKDVDGFTYQNLGRLYNNNSSFFIPATAKGIISLFKEYKIPVLGKNVCIINRSLIVGKPLTALLVNAGATVSICNSHTKNLKEHTLKSDIIISATGKSKMIKSEMLKKDSIFIDVGISRLENNKISGDGDIKELKNKCLAITPVPGGVGPMTIASLLENVYLSFKQK